MIASLLRRIADWLDPPPRGKRLPGVNLEPQFMVVHDMPHPVPGVADMPDYSSPDPGIGTYL